MRYFSTIIAATALVAATVASTTSCKKQDDGFARALVVATNDLTPTGCGYLLRLQEGGALVKPLYLPSAYQHDSLGVLVKYSLTGTQSNCAPQTPYDQVSIDDIKRDL